ncbi:hypothetical protein [Frigidibacter sp. SD6-1]|uniref:hypothetical protein n=1 Tax=Frigidibacter sp. SD6-1 TaxID=3032581 RepID=UPI0024E00AFA|nr:hypothetical protein [Frigidibacter sp. SD6-1]
MDSRLKAPLGVRLLLIVIILASVLNYALHGAGFAIFSEDIVNRVISDGLQHEIANLRKSDRYALSADSYSSFLVIITLQVYVSWILLLTLIIRQILVRLSAIREMEIERLLVLSGIFLSIAIVSYYLSPIGPSIVFSDNPRLGGKSILVGMAFLAGPMLLLLSGLVLCLLAPGIINDASN